MDTAPSSLALVPDPYRDSRCYDGVTLRRVLAYCVDLLLIGSLVALVWLVATPVLALSLGALFPIIALGVSAIPLLYHSLQIGGPRSATMGMRLFGLRVHSLSGHRPSLPQALVHVVVFYGSIAMTGSLILLVALFNARRRTLHDWLTGTVVLRDVS